MPDQKWLSQTIEDMEALLMREPCENCPQDGPELSVEDARLRLLQRLKDCGWTKSRIRHYLNTHLPLSVVK